MKRSKKAMLAAGLLAGAAAMTGCTSNTNAVATPTPVTNEQMTADPAADQPGAETSGTETTQDAEAGTDGADAPIALRVDGQEAAMGALTEKGTLLLPLVETGELLGWEVDEQSAQEETQTRRSVSLTREGSRITVAWVVSDNTIRQITWQRDGLLVPVDTMLTSAGDDVIYAPAAFFEEAMGAMVSRVEGGVEVDPPKPKQTPETQSDGDI